MSYVSMSIENLLEKMSIVQLIFFFFFPFAVREWNGEKMGEIPESGRSPGGGHGDSLQYSCLENPTDRGAWWATVHGVTKGRT